MRKSHVSSTFKIPAISEFSALKYSGFNIKRNEKILIKNPQIYPDANYSYSRIPTLH